MEKQNFYSSNYFMPNQMGMVKPHMINKYNDCKYPMQPMMPQPFTPTTMIPQAPCMPQVDLYKSFNFPTTQPMYAPQMTWPQMQTPVSMESMFLKQQPEVRIGEKEKELPPLIPIQPIKLPEIKPMPKPEMKPMPKPEMKPIPKPEVIPQPKPIFITVKKTEAQLIPQQPMVCPVEECMPFMPCEPCMLPQPFMPCEPCMLPQPFMPCEPCMLPQPFMPCPPQAFGFDFEQPMSCSGDSCYPFMGQQMPFGMFAFNEE